MVRMKRRVNGFFANGRDEPSAIDKHDVIVMTIERNLFFVIVYGVAIELESWVEGECWWGSDRLLKVKQFSSTKSNILAGIWVGIGAPALSFTH